ncbi:MAG: glycosyl transferase [Ramlibacter sp.]|nr:glycosyl transferase [Ramlibacter sp.]
MRILICSFDFYPVVAGGPSAAMTLAMGLARRGYDITVATASPAADNDHPCFPFAIVRQPGARQLVRLFQAADLVWQNHVSLRMLWPMMLVRRPLVIVHHSPLATDAPQAKTGLRVQYGGLKRAACLLGRNAFVSEAFRKAAGLSGPVIYNSYDELTFHPWPDVPRDRDVVFLGRLVPQKGADLLIEALALLAARGLRLRATIIGFGQEDEALKAMVSMHGLAGLVEFAGALRGEALSRMLARHRMMAMPSRWFEGFPISAIEALACGCVVVGSDCGGVPEAIGPAGMVVAEDCAAELAAALERLASDAALYESYRARIAQHLQIFSEAALMGRCEQLIHDAAGPAAVAA